MQIGLKYLLVFCCCFGLLATTANAQSLSKQEKKEWKKRAKQYKKNPAALKALSEETQDLRSEVSELEAEANQLRQQNQSLQANYDQQVAQATSLQAELNQMTTKLQEAQMAMQSNRNAEVETSATNLRGVIFRVQIGAYENRQIDEELVTTENLSLEEQANLQKIVVGQFRDYYKAQELRDKLKTIGIKGAWIVSYRDGVRVPVEDALRG